MPIGFDVSERMKRTPARKSYPCTYVNEIGWSTPIPPASEIAATSSGLLHGYMAPPMIGSAMPSCRVRTVSKQVCGTAVIRALYPNREEMRFTRRRGGAEKRQRHLNLLRASA